MNARVPSQYKIMEYIITNDPDAGEYYKCKKPSTLWEIASFTQGIAGTLHYEFRLLREEARAEHTVDVFKYEDNLTEEKIN